MTLVPLNELTSTGTTNGNTHLKLRDNFQETDNEHYNIPPIYKSCYHTEVYTAWTHHHCWQLLPEWDRLSMVTIQPTYHITKVNFMHTLKQCSAITECLHGYTDLQFSVRYLTPTRCISYQCCSFRKKTFVNSSRLGGYSQPRLFQVHTVVVW